MTRNQYRVVRIPNVHYMKAIELQQKVFQERGAKIPLWECLYVVKQEKTTGYPDPFEQLRRIRL